MAELKATARPSSFQCLPQELRLGQFADRREADHTRYGDEDVDDPRDHVYVAETHPAGNQGDEVELEEAYQSPVHRADCCKNYRYNLYDFN